MRLMKVWDEALWQAVMAQSVSEVRDESRFKSKKAKQYIEKTLAFMQRSNLEIFHHNEDKQRLDAWPRDTTRKE